MDPRPGEGGGLSAAECSGGAGPAGERRADGLAFWQWGGTDLSQPDHRRSADRYRPEHTRSGAYLPGGTGRDCLLIPVWTRHHAGKWDEPLCDPGRTGEYVP